MPEIAIEHVKEVKPLTAMELLGEEFRQRPSIELAQQIVALQTAMDNHSVAMEKFQWEREQRQDEIDFGMALSACQAEIGRIQPNVERKLKSGATMSWFANYPHLDDTIRPIYLKHGFAISYSEVENPPAGKVGVRATLTRGRTTRDYTQFLSIAEGNQATTKADLDASSSSRCMRYLLIKIFNVAVAIDKEEMKPFAPTMEASASEDWQLAIRECEERPRRQQLWKDAVKAAGDDAYTIKLFDVCYWSTMIADAKTVSEASEASRKAAEAAEGLNNEAVNRSIEKVKREAWNRLRGAR